MQCGGRSRGKKQECFTVTLLTRWDTWGSAFEAGSSGGPQEESSVVLEEGV